MAHITVNDQHKDVPDGTSIHEACEAMGVPFGCRDGLCASCEVKVLEGMQNLSEKTEAERDMTMPDGNRLACQCTIKKGSVKLTYDM
ncbi:MAG: 2Fe-2S iron-sulfur cluster-binding protein [Nanoarchaeota archaeon]